MLSPLPTSPATPSPSPAPIQYFSLTKVSAQSYSVHGLKWHWCIKWQLPGLKEAIHVPSKGRPTQHFLGVPLFADSMPQVSRHLPSSAMGKHLAPCCRTRDQQASDPVAAWAEFGRQFFRSMHRKPPDVPVPVHVEKISRLAGSSVTFSVPMRTVGCVEPSTALGFEGR